MTASTVLKADDPIIISSRNRRGGEHLTNPTGVLFMADAEAKLDRLVEMVSDVRVDVARLSGRSDARDRELAAIRLDIDEVKARPQGLTGRALTVALGAVASGAAALVTILDKVHIG